MNFIKKIFYGKKLDLILESGRENLLSENYFMAIKDFTFALQIDPKNEEGLFNRGLTQYKVKHFSDSLGDFLSLEKINSDFNPLQNYYLSNIYLKLNDAKSASEYANKYYKTNPNDTKIQFFAARMKYFNGEYDDALIISNRLCELLPENYNVRYLRGLINFALKNYENASVDIDKAIEISSVEDYLFNIRGLINIKCGKYNEAVEDFEYAIRLNPEKAFYYFNKAKILYQLNELTEAKISVEKSLEIEPNNKFAILLKAELNLLSENYENAIEDLELYQTFEPGNLEIILKKAALKTMIYDLEGAKKDIEKAIKLKSGDAELYFNLAFTEFKLNNYSNAITNLKTAIQKNPEFSSAYLQKGILEFLTNNFEDSVNSLEKYLQLQPETEKAIILKSRALIEIGKLSEAEFELERIKDSADSDEYQLLKSKINYANGNLEIAQKAIQEAANSGKFDKSIELINNTLKLESGLSNDIREINENKLDSVYKLDSQILNTLISFEKEHYHTVKYKLANIKNLDKKKEEQLKPINDFVNGQIG
ncbi:MAG: tetratricopeptide repeat protein [Ignavibacteriae bacterium]|nr:tetratricopeptide repeat protein [Ignavibacteriota bacterium]